MLKRAREHVVVATSTRKDHVAADGILYQPGLAIRGLIGGHVLYGAILDEDVGERVTNGAGNRGQAEIQETNAAVDDGHWRERGECVGLRVRVRPNDNQGVGAGIGGGEAAGNGIRLDLDDARISRIHRGGKGCLQGMKVRGIGLGGSRHDLEQNVGDNRGAGDG